MLTLVTDRIAHRPRRTLLLTLIFVVVAGVLGGSAADALEDSGGFTTTDSGSARAVQRIEAASGLQAAPGVILLVATPDGAERPEALARVAALGTQLADVPGVASVASAASLGTEGFVATDGSSTFLAATLRADADDAAVADAVLGRFGDLDDVEVGGPLIANTQIGETVGGDLGRAELFAFPVLLLLSLLFFRGRATVLPLLVGVTTVLGSFLLLRGIDQVTSLSVFALNLVIGLGLGLAVDYSLFLVTRFREELVAVGAGPEALRRTMATAGRTVLFSAATVAVALATLTVFPLDFLTSMGIAGAVVAVVAAAASLVISAALFTLWGARLLVHRRGAARSDGPGRWYRLSHAVLRRPGVVAAGTGLLMLAMALPALRTEFTPADSTVIPIGASSRTVADSVAEDYAGQGTTPIAVVVPAPSSDAGGVSSYAAGLGALDGVRDVRAPQLLDADTWLVDVQVAGSPDGAAARELVTGIRDGDGGYRVLVGGPAAEFVDQQASIGSRLPLALALLALCTFLILWLMTGSVVLPVKAIVMNVLTVGASLGILTLVFQDGRFQDVLGYTSNGGVEPTNFLVAAALIFALSTDYGVFLLGRIKEARGSGRSEREAVAVGLERTVAVVTAAAILLAVAIGSFVTSSISFIQQIGVATAAGVLIDAFVVRALLVPALMGLLGSWNWWSPAPLRRLHDLVGLHEELPARPAPGHVDGDGPVSGGVDGNGPVSGGVVSGGVVSR